MNSADSDNSEFEAYHFYLRQLRQVTKRDDVPKEIKKSAKQLILRWEFYQINDDEFVEIGNELLKQMETKLKVEEEDQPEEQSLEPQDEENPCDSTYSMRYDDLVEEWDRRLFNSRNKKNKWTFYRDQNTDEKKEKMPQTHYLKRDKTEFWAREQPTRRHLAKLLRKRPWLQRQNDSQPQM